MKRKLDSNFGRAIGAVLGVFAAGTTLGGALSAGGPALGGLAVAALAQTDDRSQADEAEGPYTVVHAGTIITNAGKEIRNGVIIIADGKIRGVGKGLEYPKNSKIIHAEELVVMPGMINPASRFGLDGYARSELRAHLLVADEYFPRSGDYDELIETGYTALGLFPGGSGIPGRAMVVRTGGPPEKRTLLSPGYVRIAGDGKVLRDSLRRAEAEIEKAEKARKDFDEKQKAESGKATSQPASGPTSHAASQPASQPAFQPPPIEPALQPLVDLLQGKEGLAAMIDAPDPTTYVRSEELLKEHDVSRVYRLFNRVATEFHRVVESLGEAHARVVVFPYLNWISNSWERVHLVKMLSEAGCEISVTPVVDSLEAHGEVRLRLAALVADGWSREEALKSVTLHPAKALGLEKRLGSVEKGKDADLVFLDGDPLDPFSRVRKIMISGEIVRTIEKGIR
ncbi:MAG: Adenine deaminase [Phycisphaerae bacterium]|nr:Adenine deaminase [Phycisphaerae bacterium]